MITVEWVEEELRQDMRERSFSELQEMAEAMGVDVESCSSRRELEEACVMAELHAFTH